MQKLCRRGRVRRGMNDITTLQTRVAQTSHALGHSEDPTVILLFLLEELGEVSRAFLKERGHKQNNNRVMETFREEMGDLLYMLLRLAHATNVDLEESLEHTIQKLNEGKK